MKRAALNSLVAQAGTDLGPLVRDDVELVALVASRHAMDDLFPVYDWLDRGGYCLPMPSAWLRLRAHVQSVVADGLEFEFNARVGVPIRAQVWQIWTEEWLAPAVFLPDLI